MREWITLALLGLGGFFSLVSALGIFRMPDLLTRMQAATKASTLGVGFLLLAVAVHFGDGGTVIQALLTVIFLLLTAPVAAHMIGRAGYFEGTPLWKGTIKDELRPRYDQKTHELESPPKRPINN